MSNECMCGWALWLQMMKRLPLKVLECRERTGALIESLLESIFFIKTNAHEQHWSKGGELTRCNKLRKWQLRQDRKSWDREALMVQLLTGSHSTSLHRKHGEAHKDFRFGGSTQEREVSFLGKCLLLCFFYRWSQNLRIHRNGCHSCRPFRTGMVLHSRGTEQGRKVGDALGSV